MTGIASPSASPLRDFFAPRLASIQPEVSEAYRAEYSWAGMPVITDQLALVMVNDTRRPGRVSGGWSAAAWMEPFWPLKSPGSLIAGEQAQVVLEAAVVTFCGPAQEILVFSLDRPGFARVIYNPARVVAGSSSKTLSKPLLRPRSAATD